MMEDKYGLLVWDNWFAGFYGLGQALLFVMWLSVAYLIINAQGVSISSLSFSIAGVLGGVGSYWYAVRGYERRVR